mgnify:CR=1 FL=1
MNSNEILVSLDIGTSSVKIIIGEMVNGSLNIIGVGNVQSEGLRKGSIVDIDLTVRSIRRAVEQAERMIGMEINRVIVGIPANHVSLRPCHGVVAVSTENKEITDVDVSRVLDAAQVISIPAEREIIDVIPKQFIVDDLGEINDPRGMIGVRLEMEGMLITGSKSNLHNILRCVEKAGLEIADITLQPLAAGHFALSKDEKNIGVALIDIGGGSTTIAVFEDGFLKSTSVIPVGGDHITKDLSIGLRTTTEDAERVKVEQGCAFYDIASEDIVVTVPVIGSNEKQKFTQLEIADIIEARVEEIFELALAELNKMGVEDLPGGYVLTGGVANLDGILELAQVVLNNRVRIACPDYIGVREPQYTTAVGIIQFAYQNAKIQGRELGSEITFEAPEEKSLPGQTQVKKKQEKKVQEKKEEEKVSSKVKKFFGYFFE